MDNDHRPEITRAVAAFALTTKWEDIPDEVVAIAIDHILDTYGVMLSGVNEDTARIVREVFTGGGGGALVVGTSQRSDAITAALVNGVAGHALDYDDTQLSTSVEGVYGLLTHPSVPVLSAVSSVAEERGLSGAALVASYVVGVEVACRVADAIAPRHYQAGFHSTGTIGAIGAAAGVAHLLGLDETRMRMALGIAASMSSGLRENFGTMTKPLHSGRAGQSGVSAALLAERGFTASQEILEAPRGFFSAAGGGFRAEKVLGQLGKPFFLLDPGVSIKPYPSGSLSHPAQDLILDFVISNDLHPDEVKRVEVGTNSNVLNALIHHRPTTGLQGKFSMEYCMATAVLRRRAGLAEFTDAGVNDPDIQAFIPRVDVVVDPRLEAMGYQHVRSRVRVETVDGNIFEGEAEWAQGYPTKPLSADQLAGKFVDCARESLGDEHAWAAIEGIRKLPLAAQAGDIVALLNPSREA
ncbi:MAG: MmgE/PrpD family protein [Nitrospiraceae bacterium]|nr:MmgE/PrpD family protein [Nitrospiraceae bacterium]MDA8207617.1 MmgE/PrpD family protein [Actinomycetota bacterium]